MTEILVCKDGELGDGKVRIVTAGDIEIGVIHQGGKYFAYQNLCPHRGGPACEGLRLPKVEDVIAEDRTFAGQRFDESEMHIICPWHGYEFKLEDGVCVGDMRLRLQKFTVVARGGGIYVEY